MANGIHQPKNFPIGLFSRSPRLHFPIGKDLMAS